MSNIMLKTISIIKIIDAAEVLHKLTFRTTFSVVAPMYNQEREEIGKICLYGKNKKDKAVLLVSMDNIIFEANSDAAKNYIEYLVEELVFNGETCILK